MNSFRELVEHTDDTGRAGMFWREYDPETGGYVYTPEADSLGGYLVGLLGPGRQDLQIAAAQRVAQEAERRALAAERKAQDAVLVRAHENAASAAALVVQELLAQGQEAVVEIAGPPVVALNQDRALASLIAQAMGVPVTYEGSPLHPND